MFLSAAHRYEESGIHRHLGATSTAGSNDRGAGDHRLQEHNGEILGLCSKDEYRRCFVSILQLLRIIVDMAAKLSIDTEYLGEILERRPSGGYSWDVVSICTIWKSP